MVRVSTIFIAICMVLIAGSAGGVAFLALGFGAIESSLLTLAVLTGLAVFNGAAMRLRDRSDFGNHIADLSRGTADLARQVAENARRLHALEHEIKAARSAPAPGFAPLMAEIGELSAVVKNLAETVASHEAKLTDSKLTGAAVMVTPEPLAPVRDEETRAAQEAIVAARAAAAEKIVEQGYFKGRTRSEALAMLTEAVEANRLDLYLQPIVTLPQRKVRFYEALARLRAGDGDLILPADFLAFAESNGLMPKIDNMMLFRCVQVMRRLLSKNRDVSLFCNVSASTLVDPQFFPQFAEFIDANRALAPSLVLEFTQQAYRDLGPLESESLAALAEHGFRFSLDHVTDLRIEPRDLADRGFRYIKVSASLLLGKIAAPNSDIHPADLSGLLGRSGIELIAERIENEGTVVDLLDYDVRFGQGLLFSPPRPVRPDALQGAPEPAPTGALGASEPAAPAGTGRATGNKALAQSRIARGSATAE